MSEHVRQAWAILEPDGTFAEFEDDVYLFDTFEGAAYWIQDNGGEGKPVRVQVTIKEVPNE